MGRTITVERDLLRDVMIADRFFEEAYSGHFIPILTRQEIDRVQASRQEVGPCRGLSIFIGECPQVAKGTTVA